jgi:putative acyl-CoA dehydrogenase
MSATHDVINQSVPLPDHDAYALDPALRDAVERYGGSMADERLHSLGRLAGSPLAEQLATDANRHEPELRTFDRFGHRIDEVDFHPSYHQLMSLAKEHGVHSYDWQRQGQPGAVVARAALHYLWCQVEAGTTCPITMTHAVVPSLSHSPEVAEQWLPGILAEAYDPRMVPPDQKAGVTFGMAMTEKQGGSDVRANTTRAEVAADGTARITGHKWFCSAPMCDAFLTLAYEAEGLSCFLVPRFRPDGSRNPFLIQRLKNKLGNRSNASSEVEYRDTWGQRVGAPGRGVATILEMVAQTRLDVAVGAAGAMRQVVRYAVHHARHRSAFGRTLIDQPLMRNVLADLALEVEAATALGFRLAAAFDRGEVALGRVLTPVSKYWLAKQQINHTAECLECHGGNGFVEDWPMARLYREAPLGSIWEGSGNVQCLDVLRAMHKSPDSVQALRAELSRHQGSDARLDGLHRRIESTLGDVAGLAAHARLLAEDIAVAVQAGLLIDTAPEGVAEAFLARLQTGGRQYGRLPASVDTELLIERAGCPA